MHSLLFGLVAGFCLSLARAPLGLDLLQWPAVEAEVLVLWRALALGAVAVGLTLRPGGSVRVVLLVGMLIGFASHGLLLAHAVAPSSTPALVGTLVVATALLAWLARAELRRGDTTAEAPAATRTRAGTLAAAIESLGLLVAGAGAAIAIEGVARHARLFGAGLAQDDALMATVFLAAVTFGAAAFGWISARPATRGLLHAVALAATAAGCYSSLRVVTSIASMRGLDRYVRHYGLDTSQHGTLVFDALIAAACFVAPAFLLGCVASGVTRRGQIGSVLAGAAVGLLALPRLLDPGAGAVDSSAALVPLGTRVAVAGAVIAVFSATQRRLLARAIAAGAVLLCAIPTFAIRVEPQPVLSPWLIRPVFADRTFDLPAGLVTIEPTPGELRIMTLDRRALSPTAALVRPEAQRLALAFDLLPPSVRIRGGVRVLLVGQLTPERAQVLSDSGATRVDRSGAWHAVMPEVENEFFLGLGLPAGDCIAPAEARRRLAEGAYDLVVVPPVPGNVPLTTRIDVPDATVVVAWIEIDQPAWHRDLGPSVVLAADGFDVPTAAVLRNAHPPERADESAPLVAVPGARRSVPTPLAWLLLSKAAKFDERTDASRAGLFASLADGGGDQRELFLALESLYRAQTPSSPYETEEGRVELPAEVLERLRHATLEAPLTAFTRQLWEGIARVLAGKRAVAELYEYVEPVAREHAPWPRLEAALALADLESLDPAAAVARLEPLTRGADSDGGTWYLLGEAHALTGDPAAAAEAYRRALELRPGDHHVERKRAIAAIRAGDARGKALVEELLREFPEDEELRLFTGPGPYPEAPKGFQPLPSHSFEAGH